MKKFYHEILLPKFEFKRSALILIPFVFLFGLVPAKSFSQSIQVTGVTSTSVCAGSSVTITFDVTNGGSSDHFTTSTSYQIYLSDAGGTVFTPYGSAFTNTTQTYNTTDGLPTTGLTQSFTIPAGTVAGTGYEISIGSIGPDFDGTNGAGSSGAFTINNPAPPTGTAGQTFCAINNPTVANLTATGTGILWYTASSGGTALSAATALVDGTHYFASQTVAGCEGTARFDVTATVSNPVAPTGSAAQTFCAINNPTVADLTAAGTGILWYATSSGGTALVTTTPLVNGTHYFASQTIVGCESTARLDVTATISNPAAPTGTAAQTFCAINNPTVANLTATGTGILWYAASSGGAPLAAATALVNGTHYFASQTITGCEGTARFDVTVTLGNPAAPTGSASQTFCAVNNPTVANLTATGPGILWYAASSGGTALATATALVNGTHYYASQTVAGCEGIARLDVTAIVNPTPTVNPVSNQTVCNTSNTTAISFSGSGTSYDWTNNTPSIGLAASGSGNIAAFTANNGGTAPVTATITVTPIANGCSGTPISFTITVNPTASVNQPANQIVCNNAATTAVSFSTTATGGTVVYNWTNNIPAIGLAATGSGDIASFTAINTGTAPVTATVIVTPAYTNGSVTCNGTPKTFTITVNPTATVTTVPNQTVCKNAPTTVVTFSSPTTGGAIVYNWTNNAPSIGLAASGSGNIPSFTATNGTTDPIVATITVTPAYTNGNTCTGTPLSFTITVNPLATVTTVANQSICNGAATTSVNFTSPTTGGTIIYNWTNNTPSIGLAGSGSGNIASFTATNPSSAPVTATITVTPSYTNGATCAGTPSTFTITVNPTATITPVVSQNVCNNGATTAVTFSSPTSGPGTITYNWTNNTTSIGLAASGTGNIASFTATNAGTTPVTATITVTPSYSNGATCTGTPTSFTITVNPTATVNTVSDQTVCAGTTTTAVTFNSPTGGPGTIIYNWTNNAPSIGLGANGSGNIGSFTAVNAGSVPVIATITVTPSYVNGATTCAGTPITFKITVNPTATIINPGNQTLCNGIATADINFSGPVTWSNSDISIGLAASGSANIPSFIATNPGVATVTATIIVIPTANGCNGAPVLINIKVNPTPTVNTIVNQSVCNGATSPLTPISASVAGATFTWTNNTPSVGLAASGFGSNIPSFTAVNTGTTPIVATITIIPSYTNGITCAGPSSSFTITVNPTATVTNPGPQTTCRGATTTINFTGSTGSTTYNWTNDNTAIGLGATGTGNISFTALNDTSIAKIAHIAVTPTGNGCTGATVNFIITVNPAVAITGNTMAAQGCNKSTFSISPVDSVNGVVPAGTTYSWTAPTVTGGMTGGAGGSGASITGNLTNPTTAGQTATYTVTPTSGTCPGTPFTLVVTIYPNAPKQTIDFFQTNVKSQQLCIGAQVGGGGQNDLDVHFDPPLGTGGQPPNNYYDNNNYDWDWQYATGDATGPTAPFITSPGTTTTHYQQVLPPTPSVFSPIGDYWFRFALTQNGCTTFSDTIHLQVTSTLITKTGGPYVYCYQATPQPITLTGSSVNGTATSAITGQWANLTPGSGTISNTTAIPAGTLAGNANLSAVTFTPAVGFTGTANLVLRSNAPGGGCQPAADTAHVIVLPLGNLQGCTAPASWTLANTNGNGTTDVTQVPCAESLNGSNNLSGTPGVTDYKICSGAGNFSFNWVFTAPSTGGPTPVWHTADQTTNPGAGTNRGSFVALRPTNLAVGDLIVVILHARDNVGSIAAPDGFSSIRYDVSGTSGSDNRGTVLSYWKIATASEPATYSFQANSMGTNDTWVAVAGRVTGADPYNPIDVSNGTNSGTGGVASITAPALTTLGANRLLISAVSIIDDDHGTIGGTGATSMTTIYSGNSSLGDDITYGEYFQNIPTQGTTGTKLYSWTANDAAAVQMFAIKPAGIPDDSAWVIVNNVPTLISGQDGTLGTFSIPVNSNDIIGYRITTTGNNGGAGKLTFYNVNIPNDTPKVTGIDTIKLTTCNPNAATIAAAFITPTVTDNCGGTPSLVAGYPQIGSDVPNGCGFSRTNTWIYVDNCGLQSKPFLQTVTWTSDLVKPVLTPVPDQNLCEVGSKLYSIPLMAATDNCIAGVTYSYSITGATTRTGTTNDASGIFNAGVSTIVWTATDGCGNFQTSQTIVTIAPAALATISGTASVCSGGSATITVTLTGTAPWSITYTNGVTPVTVNNILTSPYTFSTGPLTSNTTYSLTAVNDARCTGSVIGSAAITVRPLPTAVISGSTTICTGGLATISIAPTGTAAWSITYTDGVTPVTINTSLSPITFDVSPPSTTTYTITDLSDVNCSGTFSGSAVVTVNPKPTVLINGADPASAAVCLGSGSGVTLTATGASTYSWSPATGLSAITGATVTATPTVTTTYTVIGTSGCSSTATVLVTVNTPPVTTGVTICEGDAGTISSSTVCADGTFTSVPLNPATVIDTDPNSFGFPWSNPGNLTTPGAPYTSIALPLGQPSDDLFATNYGFTIPLTATITGIKVDINRSISDDPTFEDVEDFDIYLIKAGTRSGSTTVPNNQLNICNNCMWPGNSVFEVATYGGSGDLWGETWTPADVNNAGFGFGFSAANFGGVDANLLVDYIKITVTYTVPGSLNWYTVSSGGTSIGSGTPFNPVGVSGSTLANTNTAGTYPFYAECSTAPGCRTAANVVINPLPTITPAAAATDVCLSASPQNTTLNYTATNIPTTYSITWDAAATTAGFTPLTNVGLAISPITITVPANAPVNTYTGTITVANANGCISNTGANFTITVDPLSVGGTLPSVSVCTSGIGTLTLTGNVGDVVHWETSTDGGSTWTIISNNTTSLNYTASAVTTLYRALVQSGSCSSVYSTEATIGVHNVWTGVTSVDWNDGDNWSDGIVPTTSCPDVFIPGGTPFQPVLSGAPTATIVNLHILAGGFLTVSGTGLLQIGGSISNGGVFDASNGTVEFNSASPQTIAANTFMNNNLHDLIISNTNTINGVSLGGPLNVLGSLTYRPAGILLVTNNNLTLKSSATETAWLGDMTGHTITGSVTVERYIATGTAGPNHGKSWQLLAVPTFGSQTIKQSWQEGATADNVSTLGAVGPGNPVAGYGTMITSDVAGATGQPTPGFDALTVPGPSVKVYDYLTNQYVGPSNTNATQIYNQKGYFVFVRGDRSVYTSAGTATPTILRTKGTLFTPTPAANVPPVSTVVAGAFESVGNPYASAIDMRNITLGGGTQQFFTVWDPRLGGAYNYGAFQTLFFDGTDYRATPGGGSYGSGPVNLIQSGQAFFVQASGSNGTVSFTESCKAGGSSLFTTPNPVQQVQHTLRTSLNMINADGSTGSIVDGVLCQFDDSFSNDADAMDARKLSNSGENLAIKTAGILLVIERRLPITGQDTIFLNITNERIQSYRFHFDAENLDPPVQGYLVDNYLKTRTPVNTTGSTDIDFSVTNVTGSLAADRFMIVFEPLKALPVTFTSVKAYRQGSNIDVEWRVQNERNIKQYNVEKSTDGIQFSAIATKAPTANNGGSAVYVTEDVSPVAGYNYYRIGGVDINDKKAYTSVVKVMVDNLKPGITIYPNPITDGMIHLQFINMPEGKYKIRLLNKLGQLIVEKQITHAGGNATELIKWDYNLAHGMYQLEVTKPDGSIKDLNVMY